METKRCLRCSDDLPLGMFHHDKNKSDGLTSYCKKCRAEMQGRHYVPKEEFPEGHRRCTKCQEIKPLDEFHKTKKGRFGRASVCIVCRSKAKPKPIAREGHMICTQCELEKPATDEFFRRDSRSASGLASLCRDCARKEAKKWRKQKLKEDPDYDKRSHWKNRDENVKRSRLYYEKNKDEINQRRREEYRANPEKKRKQDKRYYRASRKKIINKARQWRKDNPERYRAYNQQWAEDNPETFANMMQAAWARRRARKQNLPDNFTNKDWQYCLEYWNNQCAICGENENLHADHWVPLSKDEELGTVAENMIVLCDHCNHTKHAIDAQRWLTKTFGAEFATQKLAEIEAYFEHVRQRKLDAE